MGKTNIGWTDYSLNYVKWFCTKVSPGCQNCYMMSMAKRSPQHGSFSEDRFIWRENVMQKLHEIPAGKKVFVNDMSDTYHERMPLRFIHAVHNLAAYERPDLIFQVLTKRPERVYGLRDQLAWPENLWLGTSVESEDYLWRLDYLLKIPAAVHFVSAEPLLGALPGLRSYLSPAPEREALDWIIVGGESGSGHRPFNHQWAAEIRDMALENHVAFYFKQGGDRYPGRKRELDGRTWDEFPFLEPPAILVPVEKPETEMVQLSLFDAFSMESSPVIDDGMLYSGGILVQGLKGSVYFAENQLVNLGRAVSQVAGGLR